MSTLRIAMLVACLLGCSSSLTGDAGDASGDGATGCCEITDNPVPGGCVSLGGAAAPVGGYCPGVCDGPNNFVRTIDEFGCPKLVCADSSAELPFCF
jgi:hypothetical protein